MTKEVPRIVFLDDSEDLRELMTVLLESKLEVECKGFGSLMEFESHSNEVLQARVAILDVNLGPNVPDGLDAFHWLVNHGFRGNILFFTGHARMNPQIAEAVGNGIEILEKPIDPISLLNTITRALNESVGR